MKSGKLILSVVALAFVLVSCQPEKQTKTTVVNFEDVTLNAAGISPDTSFVSGNSTFKIIDKKFWNGGIVCSSNSDTLTTGFQNQYSSITASGAESSSHFAVVYTPGAFTCPADIYGNFTIKSMYMTNSTYAYVDMKNGSDFSKKFATGDWFKVIVTGYLNSTETSKVEYYLADFRDGKTFLSKTWNKVDVSSLGQVDKVTFTFDSSDKGSFGINTPQYVCIDNIEFTQTYILEKE